MESNQIKDIVKEKYTQYSEKGMPTCSTCCGKKKLSQALGYTQEEVNEFADANLGLGCGNPTALITLKPGETVVDLGSGAGFDAFLAVKRVGETGKVIGIDMTQKMIEKATANAQKYGYTNVEFILADIENIPLDDNSVDVVLSNCVINLAPSKEAVFKEAHRILKPGGRLCVSDIVLLQELTPEQRQDADLIAGCVGGAILKDKYMDIIKASGFEVEKIHEDTQIAKAQYDGFDLESLKVIAFK